MSDLQEHYEDLFNRPSLADHSYLGIQHYNGALRRNVIDWLDDILKTANGREEKEEIQRKLSLFALGKVIPLPEVNERGYYRAADERKWLRNVMEGIVQPFLVEFNPSGEWPDILDNVDDMNTLTTRVAEMLVSDGPIVHFGGP